MSGEDPALGSALLPRVVDGIQQNVMAVVKHYIANSQETDRGSVNELVDESLLMNLYGPPFAAAVAKAAAVMCEVVGVRVQPWVGVPTTSPPPTRGCFSGVVIIV